MNKVAFKATCQKIKIRIMTSTVNQTVNQTPNKSLLRRIQDYA